MFDIGYSPSSISSHISALTYIHKILDMPDPAQCFLVQKMLKGCHKLGPTEDSSLPITGEILTKIVNALRHTLPDHAQMLLFKALFLIAFHGFFRLGELVITSKTRAEFVIQTSDVHFEVVNNKLKHVQLILRHFKTISLGQPRLITLETSNSTVSISKTLPSLKWTSLPVFRWLSCVISLCFKEIE